MSDDKKIYKYKYPNESFSGCDMVATIVYGWENNDDDEQVDKSAPSKQADSKTKWGSRTIGEIQTISYSIHMEKRPVRSIGNVNAKDYVMGPRTIAGSLVFAVFNKHFAESIIRDNNEWYKEGTAFIVDELPPFNIVISMANEYGLRSKMVIYGVRLVNEGQVMSVNDVFTENTYQFVATDIEYLNDEVTYTARSDKFNEFISIADKYSEVDPEFRPAHVGDNEKLGKKTENVILSVLTSNVGRNGMGRATFSLSPYQKEGSIDIVDSVGDKYKIQVDGSNSYHIELKAELYTAKFNKNSTERWKTSSVKFRIKEYVDKYNKKKYAPIIEALSDTYINIYSNEASHSHVKVCKENSDDILYYELKNRRAKLDNLDRNTRYLISTCTGPDTLESPSIEARTFSAFDKPFNDFKRMIETNAGLLVYSELNRYFSVIEEAKKIAETLSNFESPTSCVVIYKNKLENEYKNLDKESDNYIENANKLLTAIYAANEVIYVANKIQNNIINTVNKTTEVPIPTLFHDDSFDTVFIFNKDISKSEFFKVIKNASKCVETVPSVKFSTIEGNEYSYKFKGKSGSNHYVQAMIDGARSPKLEFYEMTLKEKQQAIDRNSDKNTSDNIQNKVSFIVKDELGETNNTQFDRAFMHKLKELKSPLLLDIDLIAKDNESITVSTVVNKLLNNDEIFYIVVAKKSDILNNDFLYKCKFTSKDDDIVLRDIDYALQPNIDYSLWIEDSSFNQISNITTFSMKEDDYDARSMFEYETKELISNLKSCLKPELPSSIYESLISHIEFNEEITKTNIIEETIKSFLYSGISETAIKACFKAIKYYIGVMCYSDNITYDESFKNGVFSFSTDKELTTVAMAFTESNLDYYKFNSTEIDLSQIKSDYILICSFSNDLKYKSNLFYINNSTNKMEVI